MGMWGKISIIVGAIYASLLGAAAPAYADEIISGCESGPMLGLNPYIRKICDGPIRPDGTWLRWRQAVTITTIRSTCGGIYYQGGVCPPWNNQHDTFPGEAGVPEMYSLTVDTIPPGEPGHLDNPIRCTMTGLRCDAP